MSISPTQGLRVILVPFEQHLKHCVLVKQQVWSPIRKINSENTPGTVVSIVGVPVLYEQSEPQAALMGSWAKACGFGLSRLDTILQANVSTDTGESCGTDARWNTKFVVPSMTAGSGYVACCVKPNSLSRPRQNVMWGYRPLTRRR